MLGSRSSTSAPSPKGCERPPQDDGADHGADPQAGGEVAGDDVAWAMHAKIGSGEAMSKTRAPLPIATSHPMIPEEAHPEGPF